MFDNVGPRREQSRKKTFLSIQDSSKFGIDLLLLWPSQTLKWFNAHLIILMDSVKTKSKQNPDQNEAVR